MNVHTALPFRADLQGLRAVAVLLVMLAHAGLPAFAGGFIGVDVFFVLSGYLITGLLLHERLTTGQIRYLRFVARRLKRLLPALLVMVALVSVVAFAVLSAYEAGTQTGSARFALTWTSNLFFAFRDFDYFQALQSSDLFLHTWSLGVEEQYYLLWPALLLVVLSRCVVGADVRRVMLLTLTLLLLASLALSLYWAYSAPMLSFYLMPSRVWQFVLGAFVYVLTTDKLAIGGQRDWHRLQRNGGRLAVWLGLALLLVCGVLYRPSMIYPGYWALLPSAAAVLIIAAGAGPFAASGILGSPAFVWIGDRSYSFYLWHWPVFLLAKSSAWLTGAAEVAATFALTTVLADVSYRFVERPFWKGKLSHFKPATALMLCMVSMVTAAGVVHYASVGSTPAPVAKELYNPRGDRPAIYTPGFKCDTWYDSADLEPCGLGSTDAPRTAIIFGDSIGAQWVSAFPEIYSPPEWQLVVLTKSACPMVDEDYYYEDIGAVYTVCAEWRAAALAHIEELSPDVVFVGSSSIYDFSEAQWLNGSRRLLQRVAASARQVGVIAPTPSLNFDAPACLEETDKFARRFGDDFAECSQENNDPKAAAVRRYLASVVAEFSNAAMLDLTDLVCPDGRCSAVTAGGIVVYRDSRHLTDTFVQSQAIDLRGRLERLALDPGSIARDSR